MKTLRVRVVVLIVWDDNLNHTMNAYCIIILLFIFTGNPLWNIVYLSDEQYASSFVLLLGSVMLLVALVTSVYKLDSLGSDMTKRGLKVDLWLTRILVQNGELCSCSLY